MNIRKYYKLFPAAALFFAWVFIAGCSHPLAPDEPTWVNKLIEQYQNMSEGNPPYSIWKYEYNGQTVYYLPAQCCDQFSSLYDINGNFICAPDGGFSGRGDGKCTDFFANRRNEKLVWRDDRT